MLAALTRIQALAVIALIVALALATLTIGPAQTGEAISGDGRYSDVQLYHDIGNAVAGGEDYYHAATRLQRAHGFPTSPFVTVRLPTLAWIEAAFGWRATHGMLCALLAAAAVAWFAMLRPLVGAGERVAAMLLVLAGGAMVASPGLSVSHELWAGVLVALAMALRVKGLTVPAFIAAALALAIRELALPFVLLAGLWAWRSGRRAELAAWALLLAAYAIALFLHRGAVEPLSLPDDALSQGWGGLRGPGAVLQDIADVTVLHLFPAPPSYLAVLLCLTGFLGAPVPLARFALPWLATIALLLAVFARPVNFYWAILTVPTVMVGLAFLPRAARDLAKALRR
ncbi:hypothetical protein [Novosphingobium guangzhouense]|uniref:DUF2029 domain-containing protein n=1 Tax=Novosphingobium guangzhouense TaxID=1850347 RepID=A0A2K2G5E1_9SPHN|nr:hypothetical protein [Novosphingobium guangzhouense]PNU06254.1 hypothetical protein A8V01_12970 [Novosphingobium guangzhouense]